MRCTRMMQVTETFILISVVEALNWRMRRSIVNISFQVRHRIVWRSYILD